MSFLLNRAIQKYADRKSQGFSPASPEEKLAEAVLLTLKLARESLGHRAERWLESPKVSLNGNTPIATMTNIDGCRKVYRLILWATSDTGDPVAKMPSP